MSDQRSTILVGTDGSTPSDRAIGWAADEAARYGKILRILHVVETSTLDLPGHTTDGISGGSSSRETKSCGTGSPSPCNGNPASRSRPCSSMTATCRPGCDGTPARPSRS
ncbi:universal stress protein [Actinomadura madurae]|uniref:universal stress protein n=1 Tax=Actinomadura madurae TaxID=1993 RepID=UPI00202680B4|nr:universal stress protein [Actinomadura madurae]URN05300.1 universal stress protein [Actinomadura madurae]